VFKDIQEVDEERSSDSGREDEQNESKGVTKEEQELEVSDSDLVDIQGGILELITNFRNAYNPQQQPKPAKSTTSIEKAPTKKRHQSGENRQ
jgi:hypothetical protein